MKYYFVPYNPLSKTTARGFHKGTRINLWEAALLRIVYERKLHYTAEIATYCIPSQPSSNR